MTDHTDRRAFRAGRVRLAFLTSAASKALGLVVQFLAVPLAMRSLGAERFGIYTMLVSALIWIDLGRLGIGPGLTRELALAWNRGDQSRERMLFSNATFFLFGIAAAIALFLVAGYHAGSGSIDAIFGASAMPYRSEILDGMIVVGVFLVAQIVFSAGEAARSAYQDDFINNLMNTLANLASLLLIFAVALLRPTVPAFALAVFGSLALGKGVNLALLVLRSRPYLLPRWQYVDRTQLRPLLASSFAFWVVQIATLMMHNLSLLQLGHMIGAEGLTPFAVVFRLFQLLSTGILMVSMPLWPAITDALVRGDQEWIARACRRLVLGALAFSALAGLVVAGLGSRLIPLWAGASVQPSATLCALLGLYFVIWMWNHCHTVILFGMGRLWAVAYAMLAEGSLVLILSALLVPRFGAAGTAIGLCLAGLSTTAWVLPMVFRRTLTQQLHGQDTPTSNSIMQPLAEEQIV
ncbi:oligosaccharide flippase family protein [Sphingomonas sp. 1185]|uniref:lipopolysaccharide biosynthesis protein n=1 Tax=Sphingomonas sp. 1185 TaxID=3156411 RepID=UPI00339B9649